jgi:tetratricopeptide (TPR) repeat protein/V8-like Glu-specific endopeptidase
MEYLGNWLPTPIAVVALLVVTQQAVLAKTSREIGQIAQAITVNVPFVNKDGQGNGSGVLLQKNGDVYTVLTAAHVVKATAGGTVTLLPITTQDGQQHKIIEGSVRVYQGDVDLAVFQFRSSKRYQLAKLGNSNSLERGMDIYVAGFPALTRAITKSVFVFEKGMVVASSREPFRGGYSLIYNSNTLRGMSGGPVLNTAGQVVGIHGKGDRDQETAEKTGFNLGIPIARFVDIAGSLGVETGQTAARTARSNTPKADDYFVSANQKYEKKDYQGALEDYNQAIILKPDFARAYHDRGLLKAYVLNNPQDALADYNKAIALEPDNSDYYHGRANFKAEKLADFQGALADYDKMIAHQPDAYYYYLVRADFKADKLKDLQGALADYNKMVSLEPSNPFIHNLRADFKAEKLKDLQGALADYNKAIALKPDFARAYHARGRLKHDKLNDHQGALADYNKAITLKPDSAEAYYNRGLLKAYMLNNPQDAISDFRQAARLYRQQGNSAQLQKSLNLLGSLGATE